MVVRMAMSCRVFETNAFLDLARGLTIVRAYRSSRTENLFPEHLGDRIFWQFGEWHEAQKPLSLVSNRFSPAHPLEPLATALVLRDTLFMSNRELAIDLIQKLPEDASLHDIAREIEFLAGVREGFEQLARGEGMPAEKVREMVPSWIVK
jgi:hypothetical protein